MLNQCHQSSGALSNIHPNQSPCTGYNSFSVQYCTSLKVQCHTFTEKIKSQTMKLPVLPTQSSEKDEKQDIKAPQETTRCVLSPNGNKVSIKVRLCVW